MAGDAMDIDGADYRDVRSWLDLAVEVEPLFGPLLDTRGFYRALLRHIERGTAFCVRAGDGPPGAPLLGGLLLSPPGPAHLEYRIGWLAVALRCRRGGVGRRLAEHACRLVTPPATLAVVTFGEDSEAGRPARRLYARLGFRAAEAAPRGPEGGSRQVYRRTLPERPRV